MTIGYLKRKLSPTWTGYRLWDNESSSDNSQTTNTTTETQDNSIIGGNGSTNIVVSRSNGVNLTMTDAGTVEKSFKFAQEAQAGALAAANHAIETVHEAEQNAMGQLADAYKTAKAGEQKVLVAAVVGFVAIVAAKAVGSK